MMGIQKEENAVNECHSHVPMKGDVTKNQGQ